MMKLSTKTKGKMVIEYIIIRYILVLSNELMSKEQNINILLN
jgi:hypothetical protein